MFSSLNIKARDYEKGFAMSDREKPSPKPTEQPILPKPKNRER